MPQALDALTLPLRGPHLIEASAGTGKTYTIAALYLRFILGHDASKGFGRPLTPPEILVVTFTNAATQELRDRIRSRLTQAASFFRKEAEGDVFLQALRNAYPASARAEKAWVLDQAAQWMDEAAIYTIHGWCQRMLRQHAFDSNSLFDLVLEPNEEELLEEAARDYWRSFYYPLSPACLNEITGLIRCNTPQDLLARTRPFFSLSANVTVDPFVLLEQRIRAIETTRQIWASDLEEATNRLRKAREEKILSGTKYRLTSFRQWLDQVCQWARNLGPLPDEKIRTKLSATGLREGVNKNRTAPEHPAFEALDRLNEQLAEWKVGPALIAHAAAEIVRRREKEKAHRGQLGYDDLIARFADALFEAGNASLAGSIRNQFPVALIDEFQDSDPLQVAAFETIYKDRKDAGLFLIGDPKQSIYAFRGADIFTYLGAKRKTAHHCYTLGKNYRSTHSMVNAVNQMFGKATGYPQGAFLFKDEIPFDAVSANGRKKTFWVDDKAVPGMQWFRLQQSTPIQKTGDGGYLHRMAESFASEMVRLLNLAGLDPPKAGFLKSDGSLKPLQPTDLAVLVRDSREATAIRQALNKRRIKTVFLSDKSTVFETAEAVDILHLLRACANPDRDDLLRAALATSVLSFSLATLDRFNEDEAAWEEQVQRFARYRQIWRDRGVLSMLRTLFHDYTVPAICLAAANGERSLTNLLHLSELLQSAAGRLEGPAALLRWLVDRIQNPGTRQEEEILRLESDADVVRVITIHKSKGLEYPLVFLPFVCSYRQVTAKNSPVVTYHDEKGRPQTVLDPEDQDFVAADRERLAEDLRLLYVAVTRAQFACWLGIAMMGAVTKKHGEAGVLHFSSFGYLLSAGEPFPSAQLVERLERLRGNCADIAIAPLPPADDTIYLRKEESLTLAPARTFSGHVPSDWSITSYSGIVFDADRWQRREGAPAGPKKHFVAADSAVEDQLHETGMVRFEPTATRPLKKTIHTFPRGPQTGTFLHDLLEWAAKEGFKTVASEQAKIAEKINTSSHRHGWKPWENVLIDWLLDLLTTPFALPEEREGICLARLASGSYQPELEFLMEAGKLDVATLDDAITTTIFPGKPRPKLRPAVVNGMLKGFIDLCFCHNGRYFVLDYKSNFLGSDEKAYETDVLIEAILAHRYDLQYVLYTLALHRQLKARLPGYNYEKDVGGGVYLFLRGVNAEGHGVFAQRPPWPLIERLDIAFSGREADHAF